MDVKFYATTSAKLPTLPIVNGQLIYLEDKEAAYYDMGNSRNPISGVRLVSTLPATGQKDILYAVIDSNGNATASIWDPTTSTFKPLSGQIATTSSIGLVKPDGTTITITNDGTISCHAEVTSLPASSITYDNTASGTTATTAQGALDELAATLSQVSTIANGAASDADSALRGLGTLGDTVDSLITRIVALEAVAARAIITEDPVSNSSED